GGVAHGFRPGRSCHDALRQLKDEVMRARVNWIADLDLARFFDTMPHVEILAVLAERIADQAFLHLIARMLKAGVQTPGGVVYDELGSPQGSIVSPVIANAFLDHVLDQWFVQTVRQHCRCYVSDHRGSKGVYLAIWEMKPTIPTSSCRHRPSRLSGSPWSLGRGAMGGS